jgi:hypothetical protein
MVHSCLASAGVTGEKRFALVKYHARYVVKHTHVVGVRIHRLEVNISTMLSPSVFVFSTDTICLFSDISTYTIGYLTI